MDPKSSGYLLAPPSSGSAGAVQLPSETVPPVDEHLVRPESREEMVRGQRLIAAPALPPHADRHCELDYVMRAHVSEGYIASSDLLTRTGPASDFATDTCIRRKGFDPRTGSRYLEELAFEVVNEQSARDIRERAEDLHARGVRRIIAIFVKTGEVREWSNSEGRWISLNLDSRLEDPVLARSLPVQALLDAAEADDSVVDALDTKGNRRLDQLKTTAREQGLEQGLEQGRIEAIEVACELLEIPLGPSERAHMDQLDAGQLESLLAYVKNERRWP